MSKNPPPETRAGEVILPRPPDPSPDEPIWTNLIAQISHLTSQRDAMSTNVARLTEEKIQDAHTIAYLREAVTAADLQTKALWVRIHRTDGHVEYWRGRADHESDRVAELDSILADQTGAFNEAVDIGRLVRDQMERWQEMAELLWEELQEWHYDECPTQREPGCICHRILAAKWDELTNAADWGVDPIEAS